MFRSLILCLCTVLLTVSGVRAQTVTGSITGTVTDSTGAVAPNVVVSAVNTSTNVRSETTTNESGVYILRFLPTGDYTVTAEAKGFKRQVSNPFRVEVNQVARVDISMTLGEVTETVEVAGVAPILQTETTQTGQAITARQATELPLNGRNFVSLTLLAPGSITPDPASFNTPSRSFGGGRPYVNGNREQSNNFLLDGVDINEPIDNLIAYNPNVDALQEVQVLTGNASAEFGNGNGAIVNMSMKSGTNSFHGNLFEFLRNQKLDANSFFLNRSGAAKRALRQNIFGGTLGGPIVSDRLFFFVDYQGTRRRESGPALATVVPAAMRTGNLSAYSDPIRDPRTGQPFPGNIIPQERIVNPVAIALFSNPQLYPLPNSTGTGPIGVNNNYVSSSADLFDNDQADAKIDHHSGEKDYIFGRFTIARYRSGASAVIIPTSLGGTTDAPTTGGVLSWTRTFSPTSINEARLGFTRVKINNNTADVAGLLGASGNQTLGIPGGQPIPGASSISLGEFTGIGSAATDSSTVDNNYHIANTFSKQLNRHSLRMGGNALRYQQNRFYAGNNGLLGSFTYSGTYTGNAFADFLLNQLNQKGRGSQTGRWGHRQWRTGLFFQDDFKARPNLTFNLGLRWEYTQPLVEVADRQVNVDLQTGQPRFAGQNGNSRALYEPYYRQFMPRVGVAWTPGGGGFVIRAGYGITSYMEGTGANLRLTLNPPYFFESSVTYDINTPGDIRAGFTDVQPLNVLAGQVRAWNPDLRPALIQQWNLTTEYAFSGSFSVNAAYVGQRGTHLVNPREYNQPLPGVGDVSTWAPLQQRRRLFSVAPLITNISGTDSSSNMWYNALQVSARKRYSMGLEFLASYTLSRTLTDNLGYYGSGGVAGEGAYWQNAYDREGDWGPAFFDARHNFSLGGNFEIPYGRGKRFGTDAPRALDLIIGGWKTNFVVSAHSGFPLTIQARDVTSQAVRGNTRANRYGELNYQNQSIDNWFGTGNQICLNPGENTGGCAYGVPATGNFGNSGKGTERAPDFRNLDLTLGKNFYVTEQRYFDFRAEFFNIFNHANFGPPGRVVSAPASFGVITSTIGNPRNVQMGLKFYF
ncbi:MAG TPA: TonB-dependent receptor [Bryobacteraceae bacterium]|nr:TonB-dependent receptor [Bryobacteraceae bacterium]